MSIASPGGLEAKPKCFGQRGLDPGDIQSASEMNIIDTVDGQNPANQLRLVVYPIIYEVFLHPRWCRISSINSM